MLEDGVSIGARLRCVGHRLGELVVGKADVSGQAGQAVTAQARVDLLRELVVLAQESREEGPDPGQLAVVGVPGNSASIACMISWSAPLLGRLDPAAAIAIPDSTSASASEVRKPSDSRPSPRCSTASAAVRANVTAKPSTASPRSRAPGASPGRP